MHPGEMMRLEHHHDPEQAQAGCRGCRSAHHPISGDQQRVQDDIGQGGDQRVNHHQPGLLDHLQHLERRGKGLVNEIPRSKDDERASPCSVLRSEQQGKYLRGEEYEQRKQRKVHEEYPFAARLVGRGELPGFLRRQQLGHHRDEQGEDPARDDGKQRCGRQGGIVYSDLSCRPEIAEHQHIGPGDELRKQSGEHHRKGIGEQLPADRTRVGARQGECSCLEQVEPQERCRRQRDEMRPGSPQQAEAQGDQPQGEQQLHPALKHVPDEHAVHHLLSSGDRGKHHLFHRVKRDSDGEQDQHRSKQVLMEE